MALLARIARAFFGRSETRRAVLDLHDAHARLATQAGGIEERLRDLAAEATEVERRVRALEAQLDTFTKRLAEGGIPEHNEPVTADLLVNVVVEEPVVFDPED